MAYRNKTYIAFASEDIKHYWLLKAWHENSNIDFNFFDAHDINTAKDDSLDETIKTRLRERMKNAKQAVILGSPSGKKKGNDSSTFFGYEIQYLKGLHLPIVIANLDQSRQAVPANIPNLLLDPDFYTMSVSFQPKIIKLALEDYVNKFNAGLNKKASSYSPSVYEKLGI